MAGNFGFRGRIGLNGLDFFVSFWSNAKKKIYKEIKKWSADFFSSPYLYFQFCLEKFYSLKIDCFALLPMTLFCRFL